MLCNARVRAQVLVDERLAERAQHLGELFRRELSAIPSQRVRVVRGRGMLNALVIYDAFSGPMHPAPRDEKKEKR